MKDSWSMSAEILHPEQGWNVQIFRNSETHDSFRHYTMSSEIFLQVYMTCYILKSVDLSNEQKQMRATRTTTNTANEPKKRIMRLRKSTCLCLGLWDLIVLMWNIQNYWEFSSLHLQRSHHSTAFCILEHTSFAGPCSRCFQVQKHKSRWNVRLQCSCHRGSLKEGCLFFLFLLDTYRSWSCVCRKPLVELLLLPHWKS